MLLHSKQEPFDSQDYLFELKWDGYRAITFIDNQKVYIQSRNGKNLTPYFPELQAIFNSLNCRSAVLDGEICFLTKVGKPIFEQLQRRIGKKVKPNISKPVTLIVWDILALNNEDIYNKPLLERKKILEKVVYKSNDRIKISTYLLKEGKKLYQLAEAENLEGIVAKNINSPYEFKRSKYWHKIKIWQYAEAIIGGYTTNMDSILVGKAKKDTLIYMGKIKLALNNQENTALVNFLPSIRKKDCPFQENITEANTVWVKPLIKCQVRYTELTNHNSFRHGYAVSLKI